MPRANYSQLWQFCQSDTLKMLRRQTNWKEALQLPLFSAACSSEERLDGREESKCLCHIPARVYISFLPPLTEDKTGLLKGIFHFKKKKKDFWLFFYYLNTHAHYIRLSKFLTCGTILIYHPHTHHFNFKVIVLKSLLKNHRALRH